MIDGTFSNSDTFFTGALDFLAGVVVVDCTSFSEAEEGEDLRVLMRRITPPTTVAPAINAATCNLILRNKIR